MQVLRTGPHGPFTYARVSTMLSRDASMRRRVAELHANHPTLCPHSGTVGRASSCLILASACLSLSCNAVCSAKGTDVGHSSASGPCDWSGGKFPQVVSSWACDCQSRCRQHPCASAVVRMVGGLTCHWRGGQDQRFLMHLRHMASDFPVLWLRRR